MSNAKLIDVIKKIYEKTFSKNLKWEETEEEGVYQASFPNYSVRLSLQPSSDSDINVSLSIIDSIGKKIDEISSDNISNSEFGQNTYIFMYNLYIEARRSAMNFDKALDAILENLK